MVTPHRKALETLWNGICDVYVWGEIEDPITHVTKPGELLRYENIKCKLSHKNLSVTSQTGGPAIIVQQVKLSLGNEYEIPAGSKIIVTQNGITAAYTRSGKPGIFIDHQEIVLEPFERYA